MKLKSTSLETQANIMQVYKWLFIGVYPQGSKQGTVPRMAPGLRNKLRAITEIHFVAKRGIEPKTRGPGRRGMKNEEHVTQIANQQGTDQIVKGPNF